MGTGHGHDHVSAHASGRAADRRRLLLVLLVTVTVVVVEVVGAVVSGSLALLADAGHMLTDAAGIVIALSASLLATRPVTARRTYGYHRAEIFAAVVNALILLGVCGYLAYAGTRRLVDPADVDAGQMLVFAGIGLASNAVSLGLLASRRQASLNMKGAYLEVLGDTFGSVLAILAGLLVLTTGFNRADSIASLLIAAMVLPRAASLLREAGGVLLEAAPPGLDVDEVRDHLCGVDGVVDVHDLHAWTITSAMPALSAHVTVTEATLAVRGVGPILDDLTGCVAAHFGIDHATFQVEPESHRDHEHDTEHP
ncbi:MAG TPA: cation diffusion facilitator family transporter [Marmoricola sp.]|jgi:cobalt-zinc-cadmium efflux system protein|nr:cation diffusion facilitator family transporter [Marmoricola sp.]